MRAPPKLRATCFTDELAYRIFDGWYYQLYDIRGPVALAVGPLYDSLRSMLEQLADQRINLSNISGDA